jgi:hypothetical protein
MWGGMRVEFLVIISVIVRDKEHSAASKFHAGWI